MDHGRKNAASNKLMDWLGRRSASARSGGSTRPAYLTVRLRSIVLAVMLGLMLLANRTGQRPGLAVQASPGPAAAVKLMVEADGIYDVPLRALQAAGLDIASAAAEELALHSGGQEVAFAVVGQGAARSIRFYGQALGKAAYMPANVYWLMRQPTGAAGDPRPIAVRAAAPAWGVPLTRVVTATVRAEEQKLYVSDPPGALRSAGAAAPDLWYWASLFAPGELKVVVATPHAVSEGREASLRIRMLGNSAAPAAPDHHLIIALNGVQIADVTWDGLGPHDIVAAAPDHLLRAGENQLTLRAAGDTGAAADVMLLDWIEVDYPRDLVGDDGALDFVSSAANLQIRLADDVAELWDVTDPRRPISLRDVRRDGRVVRFQASDAGGPDAGQRRYVAATAGALRTPAAIVPASGRDLRRWPGGADMIVITVPELRAALEPLLAVRRAEGLRVAVLDVADVYDSFSDGRVDPAAIRALVAQARAGWTPPAPRFLLLAGDASYDPRRYLKSGERDLIPTRLVHTAHTGWTASDVWYALPDDTPVARPALAVGRFPVQNPDQMAEVVAKTLTQTQGDRVADGLNRRRPRALLIADNDDPGFAAEAQAFAAALPYESVVRVVAGDGGAARTTLLDAFAQGVNLLGYIGHGSLTLWAQEKIFAVDDVARLTNRDRLPVVVTLTCLSGFFQHPSTPSLGEMLLRVPAGGAVAVFAPSAASTLADQHDLARSLANALSATAGGAPTLGEAIQQAQVALTDATGGQRDVLLTFNLLGDPSLDLLWYK
jgi:hypothetical protein